MEMLRQGLSGLPDRSRLSLEMRYRDGMARKEIAAALSISENGAKNLVQRAKHRSRQALERWMENPRRTGAEA